MVLRINRIFAPPIFDPGRRPEPIPQEPVANFNAPAPKVGDVLSLQEQLHQNEVDANLACAHFKHKRDLLEIIIQGFNHAR